VLHSGITGQSLSSAHTHFGHGIEPGDGPRSSPPMHCKVLKQYPQPFRTHGLQLVTAFQNSSDDVVSDAHTSSEVIIPSAISLFALFEADTMMLQYRTAKTVFIMLFPKNKNSQLTHLLSINNIPLSFLPTTFSLFS
jgi:hypothetical protein